MRLRQIEIFHAVYAHGSISAAARALGVSQPAVSKVLRHAESQMGIRLFDLVRGRLVPTDEAHALFREAGDLFDRLTSLQQTAQRLRHAPSGHLRIGAVPSLGLDMIPAALATFRKTHGDVSFDVQTLHHDAMLSALYERRCDLVFAYDPPPQPRLAQRRLATASLMLLAPTGTMGHGGAVPIAALDGFDMVSVAASGPIGDLIDRALAAAAVAPRMVATVNSYFVAAAMVRRRVGVAIVDRFTAAALAHDALTLHPLAQPLRHGIHIAWLEDRPLSRLGEGFAATLRDTLISSQLAEAAQ